jgi:hypothetical protein
MQGFGNFEKRDRIMMKADKSLKRRRGASAYLISDR